MSRISMRLPVLFASLALGAAAVYSQQPDIELRGGWRATSGARVYEGTWSARINPSTPNRADGSWTLVTGNRVTLQGTWAADKTAGAWRGTWSARIAASGSQAPPLTGTWQADVKDTSLKTLADMLQRTAQTQVNGTWRSGHYAGTWSLVGRPK